MKCYEYFIYFIIHFIIHFMKCMNILNIFYIKPLFEILLKDRLNIYNVIL